MKNLLSFFYAGVLGLVFLGIDSSAQTDGAATFQGAVVDYNGSGTKHYTVAWVTTESGTFIKSLRKQGPSSWTSSQWGAHCTVWNTARGGSQALDGYTSATATDYTGTNSPVIWTWNCRDANNNLVADGNYKFWIQYAENQNVQGPYTTNGMLWTKGPAGATNTYANQGANITNLTVVWTPIVTVGTSTTLTSSTNPASFGASVTLTATVTPSAAGGTVTFKDGAATLGSRTLNSGSATFSTSALSVGSHNLTAVYGGAAGYTASTSAVLTQVVDKATATVTLANLSQTYDGTAKAVTASTVPAGLGVNITYDGLAAAPTNAGSYAVVATVSNAHYVGATNGTLVVAKASQTIAFGPLPTKLLGDPPFAVSASASSGLPVSFASGDPSVATVASNTVTLVGAGSAPITASQAGADNYLAALNVSQTLAVLGAPPIITSLRMEGNNLVMEGNGPANGTYQILAWTNLEESLTQWAPILTNAFDATGHFGLTNAIDPGLKQRFYLLRVP